MIATESEASPLPAAPLFLPSYSFSRSLRSLQAHTVEQIQLLDISVHVSLSREN